jgi:hypothetical protein
VLNVDAGLNVSLNIVHLPFFFTPQRVRQNCSSIFMYRRDELIYSICVGAHLHDISIILIHKSSVMIDVPFSKHLSCIEHLSMGEIHHSFFISEYFHIHLAQLRSLADICILFLHPIKMR